MAELFKWLSDSCYWNAKRLKKGETYRVVDFGKAIIEEWVRTKDAKFVKAENQKEEKSK